MKFLTCLILMVCSQSVLAKEVINFSPTFLRTTEVHGFKLEEDGKNKIREVKAGTRCGIPIGALLRIRLINFDDKVIILNYYHGPNYGGGSCPRFKDVSLPFSEYKIARENGVLVDDNENN